MSKRILSVFKDKRGVSALEYSILAGLILLGVVAGISTTGIKSSVSSVFSGVASAISTSGTTQK